MLQIRFSAKVIAMFGIALIPFSTIEETDENFLCNQKLQWHVVTHTLNLLPGWQQFPLSALTEFIFTFSATWFLLYIQSTRLTSLGKKSE